MLGDLPPDQQGKKERQFTRDPAIGNIIGWARSWGALQEAGFSSFG
jgi:hypothetical protein